MDYLDSYFFLEGGGSVLVLCFCRGWNLKNQLYICRLSVKQVMITQQLIGILTHPPPVLIRY